MLIPLSQMVEKYGMKFTGILHVGAHDCEEIGDYDRYISRDRVLWIEAIEEKVTACKERYPDILIENAVVSDVVETVNFHVSNNGASSSFLELGLHRHMYPDIRYERSIECQTQKLEDIVAKYDVSFNFINLDIQGAELKALRGLGGSYLSNVDYIYAEVNSDYVYEGCSLVGEIDDYLAGFGLHRVETEWTGYRWGDALYIRK
jgi:FkbM family methyltransferase